jgi:hypothetical protein
MCTPNVPYGYAFSTKTMIQLTSVDSKDIMNQHDLEKKHGPKKPNIKNVKTLIKTFANITN